MVVYNCNPSSQEAEAGGRIRSSGSELKAILGYMKPCLKVKQNTGGPRRSGIKVRSLASNAPKTDRRFVAHEGTRCPYEQNAQWYAEKTDRFQIPAPIKI